MQAWDFKAGENFVLNMHEALENCDKFIAVLSAEYMEKVYCQAEWTAAFTKDPSGEKGLFIPIRIEEIKPEGLFAPIIYIDLFGVDKEEAEKRLMQINETDIARNKPGFPGTKKAKFPGQLPLNNIPYSKNIHFIGRKEILNELKNSLKPGENNPYSFVLCGMGAVGKTQITLAYALNNGYLYSQGKYKKAMKELEKTLKIQEKVLGSDDLHTALTYNNIAGIYHEIGEYDKAQEWYGKALKVYIKQLGADHLKTAMTYSNIAGVYYCKKEYDKALKWNKEALTIRLRVLGLNHPETAISYNNIASIKFFWIIYPCNK